MKKGSLETFWNGVQLGEEEEKEDLKFVDAGGYNRNERERGGELTTWNGSTQKGGEEK